MHIRGHHWLSKIRLSWLEFHKATLCSIEPWCNSRQDSTILRYQCRYKFIGSVIFDATLVFFSGINHDWCKLISKTFISMSDYPCKKSYAILMMLLWVCTVSLNDQFSQQVVRTNGQSTEGKRPQVCCSDFWVYKSRSLDLSTYERYITHKLTCLVLSTWS